MIYERAIGEHRDKYTLLNEIVDGIRTPDSPLEMTVSNTVKVTFDTELTAEEEKALNLIIDLHLRAEQPKFVGHKITSPTTVTDDWVYYDITKAYAINIIRGRYYDSESRYTIGEDKAFFHIAPDTTIGALTANASTGDKVISVSPTVMQYINIGYLVRLVGASAEAYREVVGLDRVAGTLTLESGLTDNHSAATPTYVQMTIEMCSDIWLGKSNGHTVLEGGVSPSFVKANTTIRIGFYKAGSEEKHLFIEIEEFV